MMVMRTNCDYCGGEGKIIKEHCGSCKGMGKQNVIAKETITIPQGIDNHTNINLKGKGSLGGDLVIIIKVKKSPNFKREGYNAFSELNIPIIDLILGSEKKVDTIYGRKVTIKIPAGTQINSKIKIPLQGFYHPNTRLKGDHYVQLNAKIPTSLSERQKNLYEQIRNKE